MPKKGKKGKKSSKPSWMSDELFALSQDPLQLVEGIRGTLDKASPCGNTPKEQAGLFLWKLLWPNDKKTKVKRAEALKGDALDACVKAFGNTDHPVATPAAGVLSILCQDSEAERETALTSRPSVLASIYRALSSPSVALIAEAARLLRLLSSAPDSRPRVLRATKDWDLQPLLTGARALQKFVGTHGARSAGIDCMQSLAALTTTTGPEAEGCSPQDSALTAALQRTLLAAGGLEEVVKIASNNGPPASAGFAASIVLELFRSLGPDLCDRFAAAGGIQAMVRIMQNTYVGLQKQAAAAGALWYFLVPDQRLLSPSSAIKGIPAGEAAAGAASRADDDGNSLRWEKPLLDDNERDRVLNHCEQVVESGAIPWLVRLCASADGPVEDRTDPSYVPPAAGKKKKKKAKKKKKKGKQEPGMQEAHIFASGCLRLLSLVPENKRLLMEAGAPRYMTHLLTCNVDLARWHTRQTLLNLSMVPEYASILTLYELPNFVTGANIPTSSRCRPRTAPAVLESTSGHASDPAAAAVPVPPMTV